VDDALLQQALINAGKNLHWESVTWRHLRGAVQRMVHYGQRRYTGTATAAAAAANWRCGPATAIVCGGPELVILELLLLLLPLDWQ
jgi:hypothetical protein